MSKVEVDLSNCKHFPRNQFAPLIAWIIQVPFFSGFILLIFMLSLFSAYRKSGFGDSFWGLLFSILIVLALSFISLITTLELVAKLSPLCVNEEGLFVRVLKIGRREWVFVPWEKVLRIGRRKNLSGGRYRKSLPAWEVLFVEKINPWHRSILDRLRNEDVASVLLISTDIKEYEELVFLINQNARERNPDLILEDI